MPTPAARTTLLSELMAGEDPNSPECADAETRIQQLLDDYRDQVLAEAAEAQHRNADRYPGAIAQHLHDAADLLVAARTAPADGPHLT